jgi:hypothetical protein
VALKHDAGPPAGKPHQFRLTAAVREPLVHERVAELVWMQVRDTDLLTASPQHDHDASLGQAALEAKPQPRERRVLVAGAHAEGGVVGLRGLEPRTSSLSDPRRITPM